MNYRVIVVSILDGSRYDITEFRDFADVLKYARLITRWDIHLICINLTEQSIPYVMNLTLRAQAERETIKSFQEK